MSRFKERLPPVLLVILITNAVVFALQAIFGSFNEFLAAFFIILSLVGAWIVWSSWQRNRENQHSESSPTDSDLE